MSCFRTSYCNKEMAKHLKEAQSKNGTEVKHKTSSLPVKKEDSTSLKGDEVESLQKVGQAGSENNVIIEELGPSSADLEPDEMFDEELQPAEGIIHRLVDMCIAHDALCST